MTSSRRLPKLNSCSKNIAMFVLLFFQVWSDHTHICWAATIVFNLDPLQSHQYQFHRTNICFKIFVLYCAKYFRFPRKNVNSNKHFWMANLLSGCTVIRLLCVPMRFTTKRWIFFTKALCSSFVVTEFFIFNSPILVLCVQAENCSQNLTNNGYIEKFQL